MFPLSVSRRGTFDATDVTAPETVRLVQEAGYDPARHIPSTDFKSVASANSAIPANGATNGSRTHNYSLEGCRVTATLLLHGAPEKIRTSNPSLTRRALYR